ncbi:hypothetical protein Ahia01_000344200, partial [Argonauta hians]
APIEDSIHPNDTTTLEKTLSSSVILPSQNYRYLSISTSDLEEEPELKRQKLFETGSSKSKEIALKDGQKGLKRPRRQITAQDIADGVKQSQDAEKDEDADEMSLPKPLKAPKIRKKITAEDLAAGIKQSQEVAADVTEMSRSNLSLGFLTVNSENADKYLDFTNSASEDAVEAGGGDVDEISLTGPLKSQRIRKKITAEDLAAGIKFSQDTEGKGDAEEILSKPLKAQKIRRQITAEDIAAGIKHSQEVAANVTEMSKSNLSLGFLSVNSENADKYLDFSHSASEDAVEAGGGDVDEISLPRPLKSQRIRKKITAEDLAAGIKFSQEATAVIKPAKVTEISRSVSSLESLSLNSETGEKYLDLTSSTNKSSDTCIDHTNQQLAEINQTSNAEPCNSMTGNVVDEKGRDSQITAASTITLESKASTTFSNKSLQDTSNISKEYIGAEKPPNLIEVTLDEASQELKRVHTNNEVTLIKTKAALNDAESDNVITFADLVETKGAEYTSEFIQAFSLGSLNEECVPSDASQNEILKVDVEGSKFVMEDSTQEERDISDEGESKTKAAEINLIQGVNDVPTDENVILEVQPEELIMMENVIDGGSELVGVHIEIHDDEHKNFDNIGQIDANQEEALVYHIETKGMENIERKSQLTFEEESVRTQDHNTNEIDLDMQEENITDDQHNKNKETRRDNEVVIACRSNEKHGDAIDHQMEANEESVSDHSLKNNPQNIAGETVEETNITLFSEEISTAQDKEDNDDDGEDDDDDVDDLSSFKLSFSENDISRFSGNNAKSIGVENMTVLSSESGSSMVRGNSNTRLTMNNSEGNVSQNEDHIEEIQVHLVQNEATNDTILDGKQVSEASNSSGATNRLKQLEVSVFQEESEPWVIEPDSQNESIEKVGNESNGSQKETEEYERNSNVDVDQYDINVNKEEFILQQIQANRTTEKHRVDDVSEAASTQEVSEDAGIQEVSEDGGTQEVSEDAGIQEVSEDGGTQEVSEEEGTPEEVEEEGTPEEVEEEGTPEEVEEEGTPEEVEEEGTPEEVEEEGTPEEGTQEEVEEEGTQEEVEDGGTQSENEAGGTPEEVEEEGTPEEVEEGTPEEVEDGGTQSESGAGGTPEEVEEEGTPEEIMESDAGVIPEKSETGTAESVNEEERRWDKDDLEHDRNMSAATTPGSFDLTSDKLDKKTSSSQKKQSRVESQSEDNEIMFQQNTDHSREDYVGGEENQIIPPSHKTLSKAANSAVPSTSLQSAKSQSNSLKRRGIKRKSASNQTTTDIPQSRTRSGKLRQQSLGETLSKTRSYRVVDSVDEIDTPTTTIAGKTPGQSMMNSTTFPNKSREVSQKKAQTAAERKRTSEKEKPKKRARVYRLNSEQTDFSVSPRVTSALLSHFSKLVFPESCNEVLGLISNDFLDNLFAVLSSYANKERRITICQSDVELYFKNAGFTNESTSLNSIIREHLSLADQQKLIPVARAVIDNNCTTVKGSKRKSKM